MLPCLPLWKACNQQVDYLDKRHCNLLAVPDDILRYTNTLEELLLDANQINELPRGLFRLLQLRKLTLSDNEICRLPPDVANFMHLQELDLSRNDIEDIPENIKYCRNLQVVDLSSNPLQRLPDGFTHLKNLTHLGLNDVSLTRLPTDIGSLSNLESLELRENLIKYLPASLSFLVRLKSLDLGSNMIDELPQFIGSLSSLEELWLDCNEITDLPNEIGSLSNLTQLDVSENKLEQLPEEIGRLTRLTDLILSQNQIEYLPDGIGNLRRLLILKADQNQLLQLNPNIGNCEFLQELLLMENLLTELPQTIGRLKMLAIFNLDRNHLANLPREIGNCSSMGIFSLRDNRVTHLPSELGNLKDLHVLDVCGNRLQYLPITLSSCNLKAIWLSENQVQPLLKFQQDVDDRSGQKILTCFLLPQQAYQPERAEELMKDGGLPPAGQEDWNKDILVTFASDEGDPHAFEESHFVRHNTPHPKELRARHGRLTKKDAVDIFVLPDDGQNAKEFMQDAGEGQVYNGENCCSNESHSSRSSELSAGSKASTVKILSDQPTLLDAHLAVSSSYQPALPSSTAFTRNDVIPEDSIFIQPSGSNGVKVGVKEMKKFDAPDQSSQTGNTKQPEKHVEFAFEDEENPDSESRLHRRDTPHHLKNKRIDSSSSARDVSEEKIHHILANQGGPNCESFESWASELPEPIDVDKDFLEEDIIDRELPPPPSFEELAMETVAKQPPTRQVSSETRITEMHIIREPGVPLGMSIAGGVGSAPCGKYEGIYVSRVAEDGPSSRAGLRSGDRLVSINGRSVCNIDHNSVVTMLKESGTRVVLVVARDTSAREVEEYEESLTVKLCRDENGLGFTIAGGLGSTPYKDNDQSIYISRITPGGAADKNGALKVGDRLVAVNGTDVTSVQHDDAVKLLTYDVGHIVLDVRRSCPVSPGVTSETSDTSELEIVDLTLPYLKSLCPSGGGGGTTSSTETTVPIPFRMEPFKISPDQVGGGANHVTTTGVTTSNRFPGEMADTREPSAPTRFANSTRFAGKIGSSVDAREPPPPASVPRFPPRASLSTDLDTRDASSGKIEPVSNRFPLRVGASADASEPVSSSRSSHRIPTPAARFTRDQPGMKDPPPSLEPRQASSDSSSSYRRSILRRLRSTDEDALPQEKDLCRNFFPPPPPLSPSQRTEIDDYDLACFLAPEDVDTGLNVRLKAVHQLIQNDIVRTIKPL